MTDRPSTPRSLDTAATVNEILAAYPAAFVVFIDFGIDTCCGGDVSLSEAARRDGANLDALLAALEAVQREAP